jgi:hypothetical protein
MLAAMLGTWASWAAIVGGVAAVLALIPLVPWWRRRGNATGLSTRGKSFSGVVRASNVKGGRNVRVKSSGSASLKHVKATEGDLIASAPESLDVSDVVAGGDVNLSS